MYKFKIMLVLLALIFLAGCITPQSPQQMRVESKWITEFVVDCNYQTVYRRLFKNQRRYFLGLVVRGQQYHDVQEGEVSVCYTPNNLHFLHTDIKALSESTTRVTVYCKGNLSGWNIIGEKDFLSLVESWVNGVEGGCT